MDPDEFARRAADFFPKMKDWPPPERQRTITAEEIVRGLKKPKFVKAGTDPNGPTGLVAPAQTVSGRPDAYVDPDTD
jgi:hypothetical protein